MALGFLSSTAWALHHLFWAHIKLEDFLKFEQASINPAFPAGVGLGIGRGCVDIA